MASEQGLTTPSSPVLDFLERKLAFEKTLNPSTLSLDSRSRGGKNIPAPKHSIISSFVSRAKPHYDYEVRPGKFPPTYRNNNSPKHRRTQSTAALNFRTRSHSASSSSFSDNSSPETPRSTPPSNTFRKPKESSPETPRHSLSSNSDSATKSESSSASGTPQNTHTANISKSFEKTSCKTIPAANFFRPKERTEKFKIPLDIDSEKVFDATETSRIKSQRDQPVLTLLAPSETRSSGHPTDNGTRSYSDDRLGERVAKVQEDVPVFCVQDYNRGRVKDQRASPCRSRSVGSELKARQELINESATHEKIMGWRKNKSSDELIDYQQIEMMCTGFKDKQKIIEAVISKGSTADVSGLGSKQIAKEPKKSSNVFRKMSFTSKLDKDLQNKIAKGDGSIKGVDGFKKSNRFFMNGELNSTTNCKMKFSKIIPKLNPIGSALRHSPPLSSDRNKQSESMSDDENSCKVADADATHRVEPDSGVVIRNAKNRNIIKELQEKNFLETKPMSHPPKQRTLPENDLVKLKTASESHKRQHSGSFPDKDVIKLKAKPALNPKPKLNGIIASPIKSSSVHSAPKEVPDITPVNNDQSQPKNEPFQPDSRGPPVRPPRRRNSGSPQKKNKAPLPPTLVAGSPVILESAPVDCSPSEVMSLCPTEEHFANTSPANEELPSSVVEKSSISSVANFPLTTDLPQGPPPRKPPRTFAHEIYANNKIRQHSNGNIENPASLPSSSRIETDEATKPQAVVSAHLPIYAVSQKKKHSNPGDNNGASVCCKPTIAPKPAHIKSLLGSSNSNHSSKRLSLIETSTIILTPSDIEAVAANEQLKKAAHSRLSFRRSERSPPDQPPPEPPSGPKPGPLFSPRLSSQDGGLGPPGGVGCGPTSLQCWSLDDFAYMTEGKLNRHKSQSDETLASYSGYHRLQGPAVEHIYATPQLGSSSRSRAASGGELHYMCSDLLAAGREDDTGTDTISKKPASRSNLIAAWKQEFRQSCRLVQHRLKKTVNR